MLLIAGWLAWLGAGAPAAPADARDRFEEPAPEFALELDGEKVDLAEGETRRLTVNGRSVEASFTGQPTRVVRTRDLSFEAPREFELEGEVEGTTGEWKLTRGKDAVWVMRGAPAEVDRGLKEFAVKMEENGAKPTPSEVRLGGRTIEGQLFRLLGEGGTMESEAYSFRVGKLSYFLCLMRFNRTGQPVHPATGRARPLLLDTFAFGESKGPEDKAPRRFAVKLADASLDVAEGESRTVTAGGASWKARVVEQDMRTLRAPDVTLRYPSFYEYKGERAQDGTDIWIMDGGAQMVMLVRLAEGAAAAKAVQGNIDTMAETMGKPTTRPVETTFAQAKRKGTRAEFKNGETNVAADLFPFTAGGSEYLLILSESNEGGEVPPLYKLARHSIEKSVTINR